MGVRPTRGVEAYDRILIVTGSFSGARRIKTDIIYRGRGNSEERRFFGFGVLPMWGGRPDTDPSRPRRGWNFSLCWYYSKYGALGSEFSYKLGNREEQWVSAYQNITLQPGQKFFLEIEVWPETNGRIDIGATSSSFAGDRKNPITGVNGLNSPITRARTFQRESTGWL